MDLFKEYLPLIFGFISLLIAIWKYLKEKQLKDFIRTEAMESFNHCGIMSLYIQTCITKIQEDNKEEAIQFAGQTEGMAQALWQRSAKSIVIYEKLNQD